MDPTRVIMPGEPMFVKKYGCGSFSDKYKDANGNWIFVIKFNGTDGNVEEKTVSPSEVSNFPYFNGCTKKTAEGQNKTNPIEDGIKKIGDHYYTTDCSDKENQLAASSEMDAINQNRECVKKNEEDRKRKEQSKKEEEYNKASYKMATNNLYETFFGKSKTPEQREAEAKAKEAMKKRQKEINAEVDKRIRAEDAAAAEKLQNEAKYIKKLELKKEDGKFYIQTFDNNSDKIFEISKVNGIKPKGKIKGKYIQPNYVEIAQSEKSVPYGYSLIDNDYGELRTELYTVLKRLREEKKMIKPNLESKPIYSLPVNTIIQGSFFASIPKLEINENTNVYAINNANEETIDILVEIAVPSNIATKFGGKRKTKKLKKSKKSKKSTKKSKKSTKKTKKSTKKTRKSRK